MIATIDLPRKTRLVRASVRSHDRGDELGDVEVVLVPLAPSVHAVDPLEDAADHRVTLAYVGQRRGTVVVAAERDRARGVEQRVALLVGERPAVLSDGERDVVLVEAGDSLPPEDPRGTSSSPSSTLSTFTGVMRAMSPLSLQPIDILLAPRARPTPWSATGPRACRPACWRCSRCAASSPCGARSSCPWRTPSSCTS